VSSNDGFFGQKLVIFTLYANF